MNRKTVIVAEIGTSHSGDFDKAVKFYEEAYLFVALCGFAGVDAVKFQWVYADEILHPDTGFVNLPGGKVRLYDRFKELEVQPEFFKKCLDRFTCQLVIIYFTKMFNE